MQLVEATERTGNQLKVSASPEFTEIVRTAEFSAPLFLFVIVKTKKNLFNRMSGVWVVGIV